MFRNLVGECKEDYHDYCVGDFEPDDIVISGMAGRFPCCDNIMELKEGLYSGKELLLCDNERIPIGPYKNKIGATGCIKNVDKFEVDFFSMAHSLINSMDPGSRKLMEVTYEAFADAGYDLPSVSGANIGVYSANVTTDNFNLGFKTDMNFDKFSFFRFLNANRISYFFNLLGPSTVEDTACSSSLTSLHSAYNDLKNGMTDGAIVNSSQINLAPEMIHFYNKSGVLSPTCTCKPFDERANGLVRGEAVIAIFLQKASTARRAYASVLSSAFFTSGFVQEGLGVPSLKVQEHLNRHVLQLAKLHPDQVGYIEAHGTGTVVGDPIELTAIERVYCTSTRKKPIYVGSVKSNIGHTEASSGLSGIIKAILAFEEGNIAPNYDFRKPNPNVKALLNGTIKVVSDVTPLTDPYITVNSFGFGGTLAQIILKQNSKTYPTKYSPRSRIPRIALISGTCESSVNYLIDYIKNNTNLPDEFFSLLHKLSFCRPQLKPYRGYILSQNEPSEISSITTRTEEQRPVWFIYSGMGGQWKGMSQQLMEIDVFASSMRKCAEVLKPYGLDLFEIVSSDSDLLEQDRNILPAFVSIVAIQITLTDVLQHLGIQPDGITGHSTGEIAASYGDGCTTLEETMLLALNKGLSVKEAPELVRGLMAATDLSWKEAQDMCPENVFPACHNADNSVTISGLKNDVEKFVDQLKKRNNFASIVNCYGFAFHSKFITPAAERMKLKKAIQIPKQRTKRWLSSSVPEVEWEQPQCQIVGDDYFVNNLVSTVKFNEVLKKIPANAITIEIGPHGLHLPALKAALGAKVTNLTLMKKNNPKNINFFLESIGKIYQLGLQPKVEKLYPPIQFPVPRNTPCISDLIKWNHSVSFKVRKWQPQFGEVQHEYNLSGEDSYLLDHFIDGRSLFPGVGFIMLAWEMLASKLQKNIEDLPVIIENLQFKRVTVLNKKYNLKLGFDFHKDNSFDVIEGSSIVASGEIRKWDGRTYCEPEPVYDCDEESTVNGKDVYNDLRLKGYEYGPEFQSITKMSLDGSQFIVRWKEDRWIPFLDACLASFLLSDYEHGFVLPTGILSLKIDPNALKRNAPASKYKEVPVNFFPDTNICRSVGIEIEHLSHETATRRTERNQSTLEAHTFIPYEFQYTFEKDCTLDLYQYMETCNEMLHVVGQKLGNNLENLMFQLKKQENIDGDVSEKLSGKLSFLKCLQELSKVGTTEEKTLDVLRFHLKEFGKDPLNSMLIKGYSLKIMLDIITENSFQKLSICEISSQFTSILPQIAILAKKNSYLKFKSYTLMYDDENSVAKDSLSNSQINLCPLSLIPKLTVERKEDVVVSSFYSGSSIELKQLIETLHAILTKRGFIIFYHKEKLSPLEEFLSKQCDEKIPIQSRSTLEKFLYDNKLMVVSCARDTFGSALYLLRPAVTSGNYDVLKIAENHNFCWVEELKRCMKQSDKEYLWIVSEDDFSSGILGLVNCLKLEPGGERIRCLFVSSENGEKKPPTFSLDEPFYKNLLAKNLVLNVWRDGSWGSFRHIALPERKELRNVEHSFVRCKKYGDLSSFELIESQVKYTDLKDNILVHIYYSALNFRDFMVASGKLSMVAAAKLGTDIYDGSYLGHECSGRDEKGRRICGIAALGRGLATATVMNPAFVIDVPDEWSLEQAATVPVVYATVLYALIMRGNLSRGQSILIHSATGGVGLTATRIAMHYGCETFVTVGSEQKKRYLCKLFPQLKMENIASSRNKSFENMIKKRTQGMGVDIVLNSLADDKFQASVRCVARHGHFIEIGKYDLSLNRNLGLKVFLKNISFDAVMLDELFANTPSSRANFSKVMDLLKEGIRSGLVKPLDTTVFKRHQIEKAFRYMSKGIHVGKVLIKMRDEEPAKVSSPTTLKLRATPNTYFYPNKSYIVIGGLGGFGMEVTKWILMRGGRNIVITSRKGVKTAHQRLWLKQWNRNNAIVQVLTLDVSKSYEAEQLLIETSKQGPVGGIFNSALVLKDGFIDGQSPETFKDVCAVKATATKVLDELTRKMCPDLDFFVCFSSLSSGRGNAGQTNYGYANSVMERICEKRRKSGLHGLAIQWGVIGDVGIVYREKKNDATVAGIRAQSIQSCLETLDLFCQTDYPVTSSYVTLEDSERRKTQTVDVFKKIIKLMGMTEVSESFLNRQLGEMGLDSLLSVEIKQLIQNEFSVDLTMQELFDMKFRDIKHLSDEKSRKGYSSPMLLSSATSVKLPPTLTQ